VNHTTTVVEYLGRYTRKGMLHKSRISAVTADSVSVKYRDYSDGNKHKLMQLSCDEFIRRYLLHVLPKGVMRVRHFGFLANACKRKRLALIQAQLPSTATNVAPTPVKIDCQWRCPQCQQGYLQFSGIIEPQLLTMSHRHGEQQRLSG
jgi:hypothetical protein